MFVGCGFGVGVGDSWMKLKWCLSKACMIVLAPLHFLWWLGTVAYAVMMLVRYREELDDE